MYDLSLLHSHGKDVYISEDVTIKRPHLADIGSHVAIDSYFYCTTQLIIGSWAHIAPHASVIGGEEVSFVVGSFCTVAAGCRILCASDDFGGIGLVTTPGIPREFLNLVNFGSVRMQNFSSLASNVVVEPGVIIGEGAVVGANSYVNKHVPPWTVWVGSPIRFLKLRPSTAMKRYAENLMNLEEQ